MASDKGSWGLVVFLLMVIIIGDAATGTFSSRAPPPVSSCVTSTPSPCWTHVQNGFKTCTIAINGISCTAVVTFSPAYPLKPFVNTGLNSSCGANCQSAASVSITPGNVPINPAQLVFQAAHNVLWTVPATLTELNGATDQRLSWTTPAGFTSQTEILCVNSPIPGTSTFTVQYSTDQSSWTDFGFTVAPVAGSLTCGNVAVTLTSNTQYFFRVMASATFGPEADSFGTIELYVSGSVSQSAITISVGCITTVVTVPSTTTVTVGVTCGLLGILAAKTFTVDWWSGIQA